MAEPTSETSTWTAPTPAEVDGPLVGADRPILEGYLAWQRRSFLNICAGLTAEQLATRAIPSSNLSLLGIVRHLTKVERIWFRIRAAGQDVPPVFELGTDVDFDEVDAAEAQDWVERLVEEIRLCDEAVAGVDFETTIEAARCDDVAAFSGRARDHGVRPAQRPRRPHPRGDRRRHRTLTGRAR